MTVTKGHEPGGARPTSPGLGLGALLLDRCLEAARSMGYAGCYLETLERLVAARSLYESRGFRRLARPLGATGHDHTEAWYLLRLDTGDRRRRA